MTEVKLYFPEEKTVKIQTKITTRLKVDFMNEFANLQEDPEQLKQIEIYRKANISTEENTNMNLADLLELTRVQRRPISPELIEANDKVYCNLLNIILDKKGLTELEIKELDKTEFWSEQDMEEVMKAVMFFRSKITV